MSIARRDVFRWLGFAALASREAQRATTGVGYGIQLPPLADESWVGRVGRGQADQVMPLIESAAYKLAEENVAREQRLLDRRVRNLSRLRLVSAAFIEAQQETINRQSNSLWDSLDKLRQLK